MSVFAAARKAAKTIDGLAMRSGSKPYYGASFMTWSRIDEMAKER